MKSQNWRQRRNLRVRVVDNAISRLVVTRTRRAVRLTAVTKASGLVGKPSAASFAFVDLDDAAIDKLIRRLQAIRGGRRALP